MFKDQPSRQGTFCVRRQPRRGKEGVLFVAVTRFPVLKRIDGRHQVSAMQSPAYISDVLGPQLVDVLAPPISRWRSGGRNHSQPNQNGLERTLRSQAIQMVGIREALSILQ